MGSRVGDLKFQAVLCKRDAGVLEEVQGRHLERFERFGGSGGRGSGQSN